jgi:autotransporter-associated beta strand protein
VVFQSSHGYTGETFINAGSLQFAQGGSTSSSFIRLGATSGLATAALTITDADGGTTVSNNINIRGQFGGGGAKTISATNTSGTNTYSGDIYLDDDVTTTVSSGGTLEFSGSVFELKGHYVTVEGSGNTIISKALTTNQVAAPAVCSKRGTGTLTLSNANNSYAGFTSVRAGKLVVSGTLMSGGGAVDAGDGTNPNTGTLAGNGTINRSVTLNKGGTLSPGSGANSVGTLTTNGQTWRGGGTYELDLSNSGHDEIHMSSLSVTATSSNKFTVQLVQPGMLSANNWVTVATGTGLSGWDPTKFELPPEHEIRAFDGTNEIAGPSFGGAFSIQVRAVPEPGALSFATGAAALTLIRRRRAAR